MFSDWDTFGILLAGIPCDSMRARAIILWALGNPIFARELHETCPYCKTNRFSRSNSLRLRDGLWGHGAVSSM